MAARWVVLRQGAHLRWGGDLRRHHVLEALATRPDAIDVDGLTAGHVNRGLTGIRRRPWSPRPRLAAAAMLSDEALDAIDGRALPFAFDFHDDPVTQHTALGIGMDPAAFRDALARKERNLELFRWHIVPSPELAALAGLDSGRTIVAGNGTDTAAIRPGPWPSEPAIGFMSGAAAGRGIETLVEAGRMIRSGVPELRLILWLVATGPASARYLDDLRTSTRADPWIEYAVAPYQEIGAQLGRAMVQVVPNPPSVYWDAVSPVKLFDAMASGRPVVVTPRAVMQADVRRHDAGLIAEGDRPEDLAEPIARLLEDENLARRLGANGREAAVADHDWARISARLAATLVDPARDRA